MTGNLTVQTAFREPTWDDYPLLGSDDANPELDLVHAPCGKRLCDAASPGSEPLSGGRVRPARQYRPSLHPESRFTMPESTLASAGEIRTAIDFESEYVVHVRDGGSWNRPETAEHRTLHGIDVWHAVRRSRRYAAGVHLFEHGILTLTSSTAALRFLPVATYEVDFCSSQGWEGLCGN